MGGFFVVDGSRSEFKIAFDFVLVVLDVVLNRNIQDLVVFGKGAEETFQMRKFIGRVVLEVFLQDFRKVGEFELKGHEVGLGGGGV